LQIFTCKYIKNLYPNLYNLGVGVGVGSSINNKGKNKGFLNLSQVKRKVQGKTQKQKYSQNKEFWMGLEAIM
jgi:hypothetical protein